MSWTREDIVWVAGYYEGEGCLHASAHNKWFIQISSTDLDVLQKVKRLLGMGSVCGPFLGKGARAHYKPIYHYRLCGVKRAYALCAAMYQFLGERRRAKIEDFFAHFRTHRPQRHERSVLTGQFVRRLG